MYRRQVLSGGMAEAKACMQTGSVTTACTKVPSSSPGMCWDGGHQLLPHQQLLCPFPLCTWTFCRICLYPQHKFPKAVWCSNPCCLNAFIFTFQPAVLQGLLEGGGFCRLIGTQVTVTHFLLSQCFPLRIIWSHLCTHGCTRGYICACWSTPNLNVCLLLHWQRMQALRLCEEHWCCTVKLSQCIIWADMIEIACRFCLIIPSSDESDLMFSESNHELWHRNSDIHSYFHKA